MYSTFYLQNVLALMVEYQEWFPACKKLLHQSTKFSVQDLECLEKNSRFNRSIELKTSNISSSSSFRSLGVEF